VRNEGSVADAATARSATGQEKLLAELRHLERHYRMGETVVRALDGIDWQVKSGEYWAIMGRSGSGKSTMLNILGCLDRPTGGEYLLGGTPVSTLNDNELSEIRGQRLGFIFQSFNLIPQLSVLENLEVPLFYQGTSRKVAMERAEKYATRVGLADRLHHRPAELSGGQQQRVAIARAMMNEPLLLLADEPTGNLDSSTEDEILNLFGELVTEGKTVVVVTHAEKVASKASKTLRLKDGRVERIDTRQP
jgi:putative ABC transport system ATP-binding protein